MSDFAVCDDKFPPLTAFEVRENYLEFGIEYRKFVCPDCHIPLKAMAVYGDEFVKVPHFAVKSGTHGPSCPSRAEVHVRTRPMKPTFVHGVQVRFPAKLIEARPVRVILSPEEGVVTSSGAVGAAQSLISRRLVVNEPATTLLQVIVEAWDTAKAICFREARKNSGGKPVHVAVTEELRKHPLELYGTATNYSNAFHKFVSPWHGIAVHYGISSVVTTVNGFALYAEPGISLKRHPVEQDIGVTVIGVVEVSLESASSSLRDRVHDTLTRVAGSGAAVRWFAIGYMEFDAEAGRYVLKVSNSRHIYIDTSS